MKLHRSQTGIAALTGILVVVLVSAITAVGWYVYTNSEAGKIENSAAIESTPLTKDVPQISKTSDLDKADKSLDSQDVDKDLDTTELDADLSSIF